MIVLFVDLCSFLTFSQIWEISLMHGAVKGLQYHIIVAYKTNSSYLNESLMCEISLIHGAEKQAFIE